MLSYFRKNDILYAKTMGKSVRDGSTVRKKDQKHIGRVIDKENNVFYSRERGIFTYDPITDEYGKADEIYSTELKKDRRRKEKLLVDFGDAFFLPYRSFVFHLILPSQLYFLNASYNILIIF